MNHCRIVLRHRDGRIEESSLDGDGPIAMGDYCKLPPHADHWWKVVALRWGAEGGGVAWLEPATLPEYVSRLAQ